MDAAPSHGEVPGTPAYDKRMWDAVPDEIAVIPDARDSRRASRELASPGSISPGGSPIPKTKVEKIDPTSPSHGEVPGTAAYQKRMADAVPDAIEKAPNPGIESPIDPPSKPQTPTTIPKTVITRVDSEPGYGDVPGTEAYNLRKSDARPDLLEKKGDVPSKLELYYDESLQS